MSEHIICGNGDRFNQNALVIDTREGTKGCQDLLETPQNSFYQKELTRVLGLLSSTIQPVEAAKVQLRLL